VDETIGIKVRGFGYNLGEGGRVLGEGRAVILGWSAELAVSFVNLGFHVKRLRSLGRKGNGLQRQTKAKHFKGPLLVASLSLFLSRKVNTLQGSTSVHIRPIFTSTLDSHQLLINIGRRTLFQRLRFFPSLLPLFVRQAVLFKRSKGSLTYLYTLIKKFKGSFRSFAVIFERKVTER